MSFPITSGSPFATTPPYSGTFIPTVWSSKMLVKFFATTVFGEIANTDWEGEIREKGDTVVINSIPDINVTDYTIDQELTYGVATPNRTELVINRGLKFDFRLDDVITHQSNPRLMDMAVDEATRRLSIAIDRQILRTSLTTCAASNMGTGAGVVSANYTLGTDNVPVGRTAANALQMVLDLASVLDEQNIPAENRWLVVPSVFRNLLFQSDIKMAYFTGDPSSPLRNGKIGVLDRFTVYVSNNLPIGQANQNWAGGAQTGAVRRMPIFAGHKAAITFATQMTKVESMRHPTRFGDLVRGLNIYGFRTVLPQALALGIMAL